MRGLQLNHVSKRGPRCPRCRLFHIIDWENYCFYMDPYVSHGKKAVKLNTLRPRQNGCHFPDDIFKCIFLNDNVWIWIKSSLKFVPRGLINNIPALVQIMAWRQPGDKPLSEPVMVRFLTHICVTRPQWVNHSLTHYFYTLWWLKANARVITATAFSSTETLDSVSLTYPYCCNIYI